MTDLISVISQFRSRVTDSKLDYVSREFGSVTNVDKIKVMAVRRLCQFNYQFNLQGT